MKKRILALALAGTTAFSMFGGLSVSAASYTIDEYEGYSAVVVNVSGINTITADGVNVAKDDMVDLFDLTWDDALDTVVVADTVYAYDWYDYAYNSSKALAALDITTSPMPSKLLALEEAVEARSDYLESDYKTGAWANYTKALEFADSVLAGDPGKTQTTYATAIVKDAAAALDRQVNQNPIKLSQVKALNTSITKAEAWLKDYDDTTSAAQILAVTKALNTAKDVLAAHNSSTDCALLSEVLGATDDIDAALNYAAVTLGWSKTADGKWVYGTPDGYLANGWNKIGGTWYYFNADGTAKRNTWFKDTDGKWYWFTNNCNAAYSWCKVKDNWYYFNDGCKMMTGWVKVAGSWYYLAPSGKMMTGWVEVGGKWYYFSKETNALGQMLANTTVDGYKLGADGAWVK